jgi:chorismate mutase
VIHVRGWPVKQVNPLEQTFINKFNFNTEQYEIPPTDSAESLFNRLQAFIRCYDSPSKLGIIYYGGHAERIESEEGVDLQLFARRTTQDPFKAGVVRASTNLSELSIPESPVDSKGTFGVADLPPRPPQPHISYREFCAKIKTSETDMLLVVDSCHAAGAYIEEPFGGRKCELFCSIAEKDWARALEEMIEQTPEGFSTSDLYRRIYQKQHKERKPFHFIQSKFDFGRIWLRPCHQKDQLAAVSDDSKFTIDVRFHLTQSLTLTQLNKVVKALQWIPYVQMVKMQSMHSPDDDLNKFIRTVHLASRLRPFLTRVRRKLELQRAEQLRQSDNSPPSPVQTTSERFPMQVQV